MYRASRSLGVGELLTRIRGLGASKDFGWRRPCRRRSRRTIRTRNSSHVLQARSEGTRASRAAASMAQRAQSGLKGADSVKKSRQWKRSRQVQGERGPCSTGCRHAAHVTARNSSSTTSSAGASRKTVSPARSGLPAKVARPLPARSLTLNIVWPKLSRI